MSRTYPRIGRTFRLFKGPKCPPKSEKAKANVALQTANRLCPCGAIATGKVEIQYNWFRGDDEEELRCDLHKDDPDVAPAESQEGPTDAQQELSAAGHEASEVRYREQMQQAGRGHLLR